MLARLSNWFDERTGHRALLSRVLDEELQGGAHWAYVFGSGLAVLFCSQVVTGLMLMATYTPAINSAWSSVFYIQHKVTAGWFVRGLHAYGAQALVVVLGMHVLQVAIYGAYKRPREVTWWFGLGLLALVQGLALTGYLLPWDQRGYWATNIATNLMATAPVLGPTIQRLVVGGPDYGQATLTRLFTLHVGVLPALIAVLVCFHVALAKKHGLTPPVGADLTRKEKYFPGQLLRNVGFATFVMSVIAILSASMHGAHLTAPSDPSVEFSPRPEWYFLFLFQLLKKLPGPLEIVGTIVIPGLAGLYLFVLPLLDRGPSRRISARLPWLAPIFVGALGIVGLTAQAVNEDAHDLPYQKNKAVSELRAKRAVMLAMRGIPPGGPLEMLRADPLTRGPDVYAQHCQKCHVLDGVGEYSAPVQTGFASREWIMGMLHAPRDPRYFGRTKIDDMKSMDKLGEPNKRAVTEFLFSLGHEPQDPPFDAALAKQGEGVFKDKCMDCHLYQGEGAEEFDGPDMTGYASRTWLQKQIAHPEAIYGDANEMTAFADELSAQDLQMVTAYIRLERFKAPETGPLPKLKPLKAKKK